MLTILKVLLGTAVGGGAGLGVRYLSCSTGACPIASNRVLMVLLGAAVGVMLALSGCSKGPASAPSRSEATSKPAVTTALQFETNVLKSAAPVVVDFYADWCPPCRELAPVLDRLEQEYAGRIKFVRVNVDNAMYLAREHRIDAIPTLEMYRNGKQVDRAVGAPPEAELRQRLNKLAKGS